MATPKGRLNPTYSRTRTPAINPTADTFAPDEELAEEIVAVDSMGGGRAVLSPTGGIKIVAGGYDIQITPARRAPSLERKFRRLAEQWRKDTGHLSVTFKKAMHPAYQQIIGMGEAAIPFILRELRERPTGSWFWALNAINGDEEDPAKDADDIDSAIEAWLRWGSEQITSDASS